MDGGISQPACATLAAHIVEAYLAEAIPSDRGGDPLWEESSAMLSQFRSDLQADPQRPAAQASSQGKWDSPHGTAAHPAALRLTTLLSSRPPIAQVLLARDAAASAAGISGRPTGDLSWLCGPRTRALMHEVVDSVWPPDSSDMVRGWGGLSMGLIQFHPDLMQGR